MWSQQTPYILLLQDRIHPCGRGRQNTEHVLQDCALHEDVRQQCWPVPTTLREKLQGSRTTSLEATTVYKRAIGIEVWLTWRKNEEEEEEDTRFG